MRIHKPLVILALTLSVTSIAAASYSGVNVFLPSIGTGPGYSNSYWDTMILVHNPGTSPANVQFHLLKRGHSNLDPLVFYDTIPPGDTRRYENATQTLFGINAFGAIRVLSDERVIVNARTHSTPAGGGPEDSVGQFLPAIPSSFSLRSGDSSTVLGGFQTDPREESLFRFNFGLVETAGGTAQVLVRAIADNGQVLAEQSYEMEPYEANQWNIADLAAIDHDNFRIEVEVLSGDGAVIAFGSTMANVSNDPSAFQMTIDPTSQSGGSGIQRVDAGAGLTGGGSGTTVTLDIGQGSGILVGDNSISLAPLIDVAMARALGDNGSLNAMLSSSGENPNNGFVSVHDFESYLAGGLFVEDATLAGAVALYGSNGTTNAWIGSDIDNTSNGFVGLYDDFGDLRNHHTILESGEGVSALYGPNGELNLNLASNFDDPDSGALTLRNEEGYAGLLLIVDENDYGVVETYGWNGELNTMLASSSAGDDYGWLGVFDPSGQVQASMYVDWNGYGYVWASGSYAAWLHPTSSDQTIVYSHLQGPEDTVFLRGKVELVGGRATIGLPDHFVVSADISTLSVQLTPHSLESRGLAVASIEAGSVGIGELMNGDGSYEVSYFIQAVRSVAAEVPVVSSTKALRRPGGLMRRPGDVSATDAPKKRRDKVSESNRTTAPKLAGTRK